MKFTAKITVLGMKASKGTLENGTAYDSTKVYAVVDMDATKGTALGKSAAEYTMGLSGEIERFRGNSFPFDANGEFEIVTNGRTTKTLLHFLAPITSVTGADKPVKG